MKPFIPMAFVAIAIGCLAGCSESPPESSSDAFSGLANVHEVDAVIEDTALIDERLIAQNADGNWGASVFEKETVLTERPEGTASAPILADSSVPTAERKAFFGDLHVHTEYSFDGYAMGTLTTPYDAYRFARGEAIGSPAGFDMQMSQPLDFYAVTDHGMFLGLAKAAGDTSTEFSKTAFAEPYNGLNDEGNQGIGYFDVMRRLSTFSSFLPRAVGGIRSGELDRDQVLEVVRTAWEDTIDAAEQFNDPGTFTAFVGYEYTPSGADMGNLHRNVIFKGTDALPREPFSRFHSVNPEDLWDWMDELRAKGVESLAIPHNSNGSNGQMFKLEDWAGNPMDDDYGAQRIRNEPIVEITQIKGTSETHPLLSTRDEFAGFEIMPYRVATNALSAVDGSYARQALKRGLSLEQSGVTNPYEFGFIGSSDTHSSATQVEENNFVSKLSLLSGTAAQRGSVPREGLDGSLFYYGNKITSKLRPSARGNNSITKVDGDIYGSGAAPTFGASGLAAAWAEENTRESLYAAFRRKEVFATSGPRIRVRFFAGYDFPEDLATSTDAVDAAYAGGVPMGGRLTALQDSEPNFLVMATADPLSAPLQRLQVIKGWIDEQGETHETVIDVACAGGAEVDPGTNRCPHNGATVDLSDCSINPETGAGTLTTVWTDPDFNPDHRSFYYARVIENPTCRWSTWDAIREGYEPRPGLARTLQERAWSSPIHLVPQGD